MVLPAIAASNGKRLTVGNAVESADAVGNHFNVVRQTEVTTTATNDVFEVASITSWEAIEDNGSGRSPAASGDGPRLRLQDGINASGRVEQLESERQILTEPETVEVGGYVPGVSAVAFGDVGGQNDGESGESSVVVGGVLADARQRDVGGVIAFRRSIVNIVSAEDLGDGVVGMSAAFEDGGAKADGEVEGVEDVESDGVIELEDDHISEGSTACGWGRWMGTPWGATAWSVVGRIAESNANGSTIAAEGGDALGDVSEEASGGGVGLGVRPGVGDGEATRLTVRRRRYGMGGGRQLGFEPVEGGLRGGAEVVTLGGVGEGAEELSALGQPVEEGLTGDGVEVGEEFYLEGEHGGTSSWVG